ncbi:MAG: metallophosphoesterase [Thermoanaerobaculia bacterium]|nr:metallophosphoesterase [Thermoanaerobaculia bacterium]
MRRIVHISDVHFGPHHLPQVAAGVLALIRDERPDLVALSGDLTQRAKPHQFRAARGFAESIPAPVVVVPGNHDVPLYRFWERVFSPFGAYRKHFSHQLEPFFHDDEMLVMGVNTAFNWTLTDGRITRRQQRLLTELCARMPRHLARIVVLHHPLIKLPTKHKVIAGARPALELFGRLGVELVLAGHVHQTHLSFARPAVTEATTPIAIAHAGTATSDRGRGSEHKHNTLNVITLNQRAITIAQFGWDAAAGRFTERSLRELPRRAPEVEPSRSVGQALSEDQIS